jgi:hypothetical protein
LATAYAKIGGVVRMKNQHPLSANWKRILVRTLCLALLLLATLPLLFGCVGSQASVKAKLGEAFTIKVGQTASITGENLTVTFNEVIGDSRCPKDVKCIWAGVVSLRVTFVQNKTSNSVALKESGSTDEAKDVYSDYKLTFNVSPYPESTKTIATKDYELTMTISR